MEQKGVEVFACMLYYTCHKSILVHTHFTLIVTDGECKSDLVHIMLVAFTIVICKKCTSLLMPTFKQDFLQLLLSPMLVCVITIW